MRNGQHKPAYNIQYGIGAENVVLWVSAGPRPTDTATLIPLLQDVEKYFPRGYPNVIADAGYERAHEKISNGCRVFVRPFLG